MLLLPRFQMNLLSPSSAYKMQEDVPMNVGNHTESTWYHTQADHNINFHHNENFRLHQYPFIPNVSPDRDQNIQ